MDSRQKVPERHDLKFSIITKILNKNTSHIYPDKGKLTPALRPNLYNGLNVSISGRHNPKIRWDSQVRSTAADSRSAPAEVLRFESGSQHATIMVQICDNGHGMPIFLFNYLRLAMCYFH